MKQPLEKLTRGPPTHTHTHTHTHNHSLKAPKVHFGGKDVMVIALRLPLPSPPLLPL